MSKKNDVMGHAGIVLSRINEAEFSGAPVEEIAKLYSQLISDKVLELLDFYHPHAPISSQAVFNTHLKVWKEKIDEITDPSVKIGVVVEALEKWTSGGAFYFHDVKEVALKETWIVAGRKQEGKEISGTDMLEVIDVQVMRLRQAIAEGKKLYAGISEQHPEELGILLKSMDKDRFKKFMDDVLKDGWLKPKQKNAQAVEGVDYGLFV